MRGDMADSDPPPSSSSPKCVICGLPPDNGQMHLARAGVARQIRCSVQGCASRIKDFCTRPGPASQPGVGPGYYRCMGGHVTTV